MKKALEAKGCRTVYVCADLSLVDDCERVVAAHEEAFGDKLDGLVNCAATTKRCFWESATVETMEYVLNLNVRAPFILMQAAAKLMERGKRGGSVVNIGSVHAHGGMPSHVAYATSKGALLTMTKNFAFAKRKSKIRANYIAVGWMATPAEHQVMTSEGRPENWLEAADASHPNGRILRPWDVARCVAHLISDDGEMHTGDVINLHERHFGTWE